MDTKNNFRVAFAGASGTGKTTLAEWMSKEFDLPLNPVGSRSVARSMGFENPYDVDAAGQRESFQRRLITDKRVWEDEHASFVTDRTTLDNLCYLTLHDVYGIDEDLLATVRGGLERYTHIVFFPQSAFLHLASDPKRVGGGKYGKGDAKTYHKLYEIVLRALIETYRPPGVKLITLTASGVKERQSRMREIMSPEPPIPHLPG